MGRYSKLAFRTYRTPVERSPIAQAQTKPPAVHALDRRLSPELISELISAYESGTPSTQLMSTYSLGKGSVLKLLREAGVKNRSQGIPEDQVEAAATLYRDGWSLVRVGRHYDCNAETVRQTLMAHGVTIRPRNGWKGLS